MAWLSINEFKRRYKFGRPAGEKEPMTYEEFFFLEKDGKELSLDAKKRYVRILISPIDSIFILSKPEVEKLVKALKKKVEGRIGNKLPLPSKDELGFKVYGEIVDPMGVKVVLKEAPAGTLSVQFESIPHLREGEVKTLILALKSFLKSP
jgi:hypothetical protein